ncbi:hypothetical protein Nepgr_003132 [Nepenthes gracilis]|uniref:RING-type domain-containing protein n=1 Tax=Nepenthes gracilis TaxID=150966 RepID=A0AAD3RYZ2_NEPGR|nr:hypothetical protein Nepgr_003132 [Nepenthes gracilis]
MMEVIVSVILLFVGIAVLVIVHLCIIGRAFRRGFGHGGEHVVRRSSPKGKGMSAEELKTLPCLNFEAGERGSSCSVDCAVCLDSFKSGDKCRLLPNCMHCFHAHCIDLWLMKTPLCPICRTCAQLPKIQLVSGEGSGISSSSAVDELA